MINRLICLWLLICCSGWIPVQADESNLRIINGSNARQNEFPWAVALYHSYASPYNGQFCGGSLIHPEWVLTAAHCVEDETVDSVAMVIGRTRLTDSDGRLLKSQQFVTAPNYSVGNKTNPDNDLALIHLTEAVTEYSLLRVFEPYREVRINSYSATILGWGATSSDNRSPDYADTLQVTQLPLVSGTDCRLVYGDQLTGNMMCAGVVDGSTDGCQGDSGGPLVLQTLTGWQQLGISSWGEGCAQPLFYGVYTYLPNYVDFIQTTICEADDIPMAPDLELTQNGNVYTLNWSHNEEENSGENEVKIDGYQLYYAPFSEPLDATTIDNIASIDMGLNTQYMQKLTMPIALYVAIRAYQGNCYSPYSNLVVLNTLDI